MPRRRSADPQSIARAVRDAVQAVPGVAGVSAGRFARVGTYGPEDFVRGVVVERTPRGVTFEVHIVASSTSESLPDLAESVRRVTRETALELRVGTVRRIDVSIDDLRDEEALR